VTAGPPARPGLRKAGDSDVHPSLPSVDSTEPSLLRPGNSTADAVLGADADKPVTLEVTVPKWLRKSVRAEAKRRGVTVDEVVADALRERPTR
jgi:hypothetical protein